MKRHGLIVTGALVLSSAMAASGQTQLWIDQINSSTVEDNAELAPDDAGGFFLGITTIGSLGGPQIGMYDAVLARYDGDGNQLWITQFGSNREDYVRALAPDAAGGVYAAGLTWGSLGGPNAGLGDAWLARFDGDGSQIWVRQIGSVENDSVAGAAPDGAGGVYIGGHTMGDMGGPNAGQGDAWLAHYHADGNLLWIRQIGSNVDEYGYAVAPDGVGGVFFGGGTASSLSGTSAGLLDNWVARYDADGNRLWINQFGTANNEYVLALTLDASGGLFASGQTADNANRSDAWIGRLDDQGNQIWIDQIRSDENERASVLTVDGAGGVIVGGRTSGVLVAPGTGTTDAWLAQYLTDGTQAWIIQFGTSTYDTAQGLAYDGARGFFVGGFTDGSLGGPYGGQRDIWFARYATDSCYADCDKSTGIGVLDIFDFLCFQNSFVNSEPYACDCDTSTGNGVCDVFDFLCFQNAFVGGCP